MTTTPPTGSAQTSTAPTTSTARRRALAIALGAALLQLVMITAFAWPSAKVAPREADDGRVRQQEQGFGDQRAEGGHGQPQDLP
ncbi:hypothetical protein AB0J52_31670, partial [Spirillospora sp. NPDC049652]